MPRESTRSRRQRTPRQPPSLQPAVTQTRAGQSATLMRRATDAPGTLSPSEVVHLQRTLGNRTVGRLLAQPRLTLRPGGDRYEQEADRVARQVVEHGQSQTIQPLHAAAGA